MHKLDLVEARNSERLEEGTGSLMRGLQDGSESPPYRRE